MLRAARIVSSTPLVYADGADAALDRPAHVRAGSGAAFVQTPHGVRLAVCQDDAAFLALVDVTTGRVESVTLPAGPGGARQFEKARGNKMDKLDLESACVLPTASGPRLHLFGSGSAAVREVVVELDVARADAVPVVHDARALFAAMRAQLPRDVELNVEGACAFGDELVLLQRGNGRGGVNAVARAPWASVRASLGGDGDELYEHVHIALVELGEVNGVNLTFTDACVPRAPRHEERVWFVAAAEASPNVIDDGDVVGCSIGVMDVHGREPRIIAMVPLLETSGAPYLGKPEGLAIDGDGQAWLVTDADDPSRPSELLRLAIE